MTQDSNAIWQEMMSNWQASQQSMAQQMMKNMQQWNANLDTSSFSEAINNAIQNPLAEAYKTFAQSFLKQAFPDSSALFSQSAMPQNWIQYLQSMPGAEKMNQTVSQLMQSGQQLFQQLSENYSHLFSEDESHSYFLKILSDMSNPETWFKYSGDDFDLSAHKFSEAPLFSGITDIDQRMAQVSDSWLDLFNQSKSYHQLIFERWTQAYGRFLDRLQALDNDNEKQVSPRQLIDLWSAIANEELLQLHRSEGFLKAQQAVIRAGMQYRLHEKNMAEVVCEALHIPTRDEVDELHKSVTGLRRELRQVKIQLQQQVERIQQPATEQTSKIPVTKSTKSKKGAVK